MNGVAVNVAAVLVGTAVGLLFGKLIPERFRTTVVSGVGLFTIAIGLKMTIATESPLLLAGSLVVGAVIGESLRLEHRLERFGAALKDAAKRVPWLAAEANGESGGHRMVEGFVTASLLYCVGAMTVLGSLQSGMGDPTLLYIKSLLDGTMAIPFATMFGVGVGFSIIPIAAIQGSLALAAHSVEPYMTASVIRELSAAGGALIAGIGLDLLGIKRLPIGNLLPAVVVAGVLAWFFA
ncbi:MAG: DUF554 domain-containing protein [Coriobacteriia bacterium]|nr:DUF554 domain-containing protein [Coriobacteriia bacterium]